MPVETVAIGEDEHNACTSPSQSDSAPISESGIMGLECLSGRCRSLIDAADADVESADIDDDINPESLDSRPVIGPEDS